MPYTLSNELIREALETISKLNNIALDNYCSTLMKVRTQQAEVTSLKPYLEHFTSLTLKAYFTNNDIVTPILPMYINRNIITLGDMIKEYYLSFKIFVTKYNSHQYNKYNQ